MIDQPPVDFFGEDAHLIAVRIVPTSDGWYAVSINSSHPDPQWTSRALQFAAEAALIEDAGPAITVSGHLVERHAPHAGPEGTQP